MANAYSTPTKFIEWMPARYVAELSDDTAGLSPDSDKVQKALDWGAGIMDSYLRVRDDIPMPAVNADNSVPPELEECVHDLALYRLFKRRGSMNDTVREGFDVQMTWLGQVAQRDANISIKNKTGRDVTPTTENPVHGGDRDTNLFDDFTF